jgi:hypothetical protein
MSTTTRATPLTFGRARLLRSLDYVEPHPWRSGWRFRGVATRP